MTASILALTVPEPPPAMEPDVILLGLPLVRRTVLAAQRAGFARIVAHSANPEAERRLGAALEGTGAKLVLAGPPPPGSVAMPWNRVLSAAEIRALAAGEDPERLGVAVEGPQDIRRAEDWLLASLVKEREGFFSRHLERKISLAISRRLAATGVTPNAVTLASCSIGIFGSLFFLLPGALSQTAGSILLVIHSVIDGCDGELARLKFQESRFGGALDFWADNAVHCALFAAIAAGWSLSAGAPWPLVLGMTAILGDLGSAGFVYATTMRGPREGPLFIEVTAKGGLASRIANALARRDFLYVVLALSLFGRADWFLALAAAGAPVYCLSLLALDRFGPERTRT